MRDLLIKYIDRFKQERSDFFEVFITRSSLPSFLIHFAPQKSARKMK